MVQSIFCWISLLKDLISSDMSCLSSFCGIIRLYSATPIGFVKPSSANSTSTLSFSAHRIIPIEGFSSLPFSKRSSNERYTFILPTYSGLNSDIFRSMATNERSPQDRLVIIVFKFGHQLIYVSPWQNSNAALEFWISEMKPDVKFLHCP